MPQSKLTDNHLLATSTKQGLILCNLGTPNQPTPNAVRRYLTEFLSDSRVVEIPRILWWVILKIILLIRPSRSARMYQKIWGENGSPLLTLTQQLAQTIEKKLHLSKHISIKVAVAMRYGSPSIKSVLQDFQRENITKITVLPLYPQYSATTTASTFDKLSQILQSYRYVPEVHFINGYHQNSVYIQSIADCIHLSIKQHGMPDVFVCSFHGIPEKNVNLGDPYYQCCLQTSALLRKALHFDEQQLITTFQSRFGKAEWLKPYTFATLTDLGAKNINSVTVICPGFAVDCLETLDEIVNEAKEEFIRAGGKKFTYIPCLNATNTHAETLLNVLQLS